MSKFWKEIMGGVIGAALFAVLAWIFGAFERRLTELDQAKIATQVVEIEYFQDTLLKKFKADEAFRGPQGVQGVPGIQGPTGPGAPIGTVIAWPVSPEPLPKGWLKCDGATLSRAEYGELFEVLGTVFGGDGANSFKLPDYQGYFLRGVDESGSVDVDPEGKRLAGSKQQDQIRTHSHKLLDGDGKPFGYGRREGDMGEMKNFSTGIDRDAREISYENPGGLETRPKNVAVVWLIRAT